MARHPVIERRAALVPVAAPVDAYARPPMPVRSNLHQVAEALGNFDRNLHAFLQQRKARADEMDRLRGEAAFYRQNQDGYAEGVRTGMIPTFASPAFMDGYKKAQGNAAGLQLAQRFRLAYLEWDGKHGEDPAAFDAFLQGFLRQNVTTDDPRVLAGMLPHIRSLSQGMQQQFFQDLSDNIYGSALTANEAVVGQATDQAYLEGIASPAGTDYDGLWNSLMGIREGALRSGLRSGDFDKQLITTITAKAVELRDPELLDLLDRTLPGTNHRISDTVAGRQAKMQTTERLERMARQSMADADREATRQEREARARNTRAAIELLFEDPTQTLPEELLAEGSKWDPEFRTKALEWQRRVLSGGVIEDPQALTQLHADIFAGGGMDAIAAALEAGTIRDAGSLRTAVGFVRQMEQDGGRHAEILRGQQTSVGMNTIRLRAMPGRLRDIHQLPDFITDAGLAAQSEYRRMLLDWSVRNPEASEVERAEANDRILATVLKGIEQAGPLSPDDPTFRRPEDALGPNPFAPDPTPMSPELQEFVDDLPEADRTRIEEVARRRGHDPAEVFERMRQQGTETERPPTVADAPETTGSLPPPTEDDDRGTGPISFTPEEAEANPELVQQRLAEAITAAYVPADPAPSGQPLGGVVEGVNDPMTLARTYLGHHQATHANVLSELFRKMAGQRLDPRTTPWCAAFVNAILGKAGVEGTNTLLARDFLNYGTPVDGDPSDGDIVVFWRGSPNSWKGHVGFYAGEEVRNGQRFIKVLGGNQANQVSVTTYPASRLLGFRRPPVVVQPEDTGGEQQVAGIGNFLGDMWRRLNPEAWERRNRQREREWWQRELDHDRDGIERHDIPGPPRVPDQPGGQRMIASTDNDPTSTA